jgi:transcriptional regulator with XRE-family HTH domain
MSNERLRRAMASANLDLDAVAVAASVDTKTVERWLAGREPRARHRWAVASLLKRSEAYLWPDATAGEVELVLVYTHRSDVEPAVWWDLFSSAEREIDLLAYAALFLPEQHISLVRMLKEKAAGGCSIRIVLGDPTSPKILERGEEEQFGEGIVSRSKVALLHYKPLADDPGVHIRVHGTTLYNSIYRFDDTMLVNAHVYGCNAFSAPVLHLRRRLKGGLFDTYLQSFEAVWTLSKPATWPHNGAVQP